MTAAQLHLVDNNRNSRQDEARQERQLLVCRVTDVYATATNRISGTVLIDFRAFLNFRWIFEQRGLLQPNNKRTTAICELNNSFDCAVRAGIDRRGNLLLIDEEMRIMYVVSWDEAALIAIYDKADEAA